MRQLKYFIILAIVAAIPASVLAGRAGSKDRDKPRQRAHRSNLFSTAGTFSGAIEGEIRVADKTIYVNRNTAIYVSGQGARTTGYVTTNASVYVGGFVDQGLRIAKFVVVRPAAAGHAVLGKRETNHCWRPLATNPNVGYYDYSAGYVE